MSDNLTLVTVPKEEFPGERILRNRLNRDFPFYAEKNLKILTKAGGVEPLILNRAQRYIHALLEKQRAETGKVRALVLKARQQGCSTYVAARYYWRVTHRDGVNAFVLSHAMDTTRKLFSITRRYYEHSDSGWQPDTAAASAHEFVFAGLDSSYYVGTAGAKETGRGGTIQYFHGSEVAFWANAEMHFGGIMQSVPTGTLGGGTEVILESTGNGEQGKFFELCEEAKRGEGEYILIFTPWFWQDEYRDMNQRVGWTVKDSKWSMELEFAQEAYDLDDNQVYWMHLKLNELGAAWLFKQEYPATYAEAFQTSDDNSFVPRNEVEEAMIPKPDIMELDHQPGIGALDPAGEGENSDRTAWGHMIGSRVFPVTYTRFKSPVQIAEIVRDYIREHKLDRFYIDVNGLGVGVYSILRDIHKMGNIVKPCNFGGGATDVNPDGSAMYKNKRAECYGRFLKWLRDDKRELPQQDELKKDICAAQRLDKRPQQLESKQDMKTRGIKSPDGGDVVAMFHTYPVHTVKRLRYWDGSDTVDAEQVPEYDELGYGLGG